jgi:hypothetical protein
MRIDKFLRMELIQAELYNQIFSIRNDFGTKKVLLGYVLKEILSLNSPKRNLISKTISVQQNSIPNNPLLYINSSRH